MSIPTLDDYKGGSTSWRDRHKDIMFTISHHGVSDHNQSGIWCFYIHLNEALFCNVVDFDKFWREKKVIEFNGSFRETYDYNDIPDYGFHSGITYYETSHLTGKCGATHRAVKMGCDYAHLWDMERGYPYSLETVKQDAINFINKMTDNIKFKSKCGYSGKIDTNDKFYIAKNGQSVHISKIKALQDNGWDGWLKDDTINENP